MTLDHEVEILEHQFARNKVETVRGEARFLDPRRVEIVCEDGAIIRRTADRFVLAVGTRPYRPAHVAFDGETILDSDEILNLPRIPRHLVVVGASVIGIEYATIFSALDVQVTVLEPSSSLLDLRRPRACRRVRARPARPWRDAALRGQGHGRRDGGPAARRRRPRGRPPGAWRHGAVRRGPRGRDRHPQPRRLRPRGRRARPHRRRQGDVPDRGVAHLRRRRRHWLPQPGLDLDGAGADRRLPRVRRAGAAAARLLPLWHLLGARDLDGRDDRGAGARARHSLTNAASPASARPRAATSWACTPAS